MLKGSRLGPNVQRDTAHAKACKKRYCLAITNIFRMEESGQMILFQAEGRTVSYLAKIVKEWLAAIIRRRLV